MGLYFTSLNSGSNGNCYYVGNEEEAVLIDAGISCRETEKRMKRLGLKMDKVKAIFVSHEHGDHISGIPVLSKKYSLPVYITSSTLRSCNLSLSADLIFHFTSKQPVRIGQLLITAFAKFHDASDPHSFVISCNDTNVGVFTDLGKVCKSLIKHFSNCHAAFLESNYDEKMLEEGGYPVHLKNRIRGGEGHLSNKEALRLFTEHRPPFMTHLLLAHLSKNNNDPDLVRNLFAPLAANTEIMVASRYQETPLFAITSIQAGPKRLQQARPAQLSLF